MAGVADGKQQVNAVFAQFVRQEKEPVPRFGGGGHRIAAVIHQRAAGHAGIPVAGRTQHVVGAGAVDAERREVFRGRRRRRAVRVERDEVDAPEFHGLAGGIDEIVALRLQWNRFRRRGGERRGGHQPA